jgi:hypothetical protein
MMVTFTAASWTGPIFEFYCLFNFYYNGTSLLDKLHWALTHLFDTLS